MNFATADRGRIVSPSMVGALSVYDCPGCSFGRRRKMRYSFSAKIEVTGKNLCKT